MSRPTLQSLYRLDGTPTDALLSALTALRCPSLEELERRVKRGRLKRERVLGCRLGGSHYRPGIVARYLFGTKRRKVARRVVALPPEPDHERAHLALFTD